MVLSTLVVMEDGTSCLRDHHLATLIDTKEESMALLRNVFKTEEMFLDMFEDEYREMSVSSLAGLLYDHIIYAFPCYKT